MGFGYMITVWGREMAFVPDYWEGFRRHAEDYAKVDNPDNPENPLFYFRKPIVHLIEDISEPDDRITVLCMDVVAEVLLSGIREYEGRYVFPTTRKKLLKTEQTAETGNSLGEGNKI